MPEICSEHAVRSGNVPFDWNDGATSAGGQQGQSEWQLSLGLLAQLPKQVLLLVDWLSGCAAFMAPVLKHCRRVGSHVPVRARTQIKVLRGGVSKMAVG